MRQLHSSNRQLALARITLLSDPEVMVYTDNKRLQKLDPDGQPSEQKLVQDNRENVLNIDQMRIESRQSGRQYYTQESLIDFSAVNAALTGTSSNNPSRV